MSTNHKIIDADEYYAIDPSTRRIKTSSSKKTVLMQGDHNSERITFKIPRYIENHDMSECDSIKIHYNNIDSVTKETNSGIYEVDDVAISQSDEDSITFSWLISGNATKYSGGLVFLIQFLCYDSENTSKIEYSWSTSVYEGINVLSGFNNTEFVVEEYIDILKQWKDEILQSIPVDQPDWNQHDEAADDYIKNRPFYKKSTNYTFPNADYSAPAYEPDGFELYRISDEFPKYDDFNGFLVTAHLDGEASSETLEIKTEGSDNNTYQQRDEETSELQAVSISDAFTILYIDVPLDEEGTIIVPPGVYMQKMTGDPTIILDSIECIEELKQIDKKFIPELDYISTEDGNQIRSQVQNANVNVNRAINTASQAQTTASQAQTTASQAQTTASQAQTTASQAQTTASQAQTTANNALNKVYFHTITLEDATNLFCNAKFTRPPCIEINAKNMFGVFRHCNNLLTFEVGIKHSPRSIAVMCAFCTSLTEIRGILDLGVCTSTINAFLGCSALTTINRLCNIKISISFADCPLDDATVDMILHNLVLGTDPQVLTLKSDIVLGLTDEQIALLPSNWQLG